MTLDEFKKAAGSTIFTVRFVKRTTNEVRTMNARLGVTKHLKGGTLAYDPAQKQLMGVFDVKAGGYRMVNLEQLIDLRLRGKLYHWDDKKLEFREVV